MSETMILIKVKVAHVRTEASGKDHDLEQLAGDKNDACCQQSGEEFSHHQHFAADGRQKVKVETLVENLAAEQIHEDSQAAEKDGEAQIEKLEYSGEHDRILGQVESLVDVNADDFSLGKIYIEV